MIEDEDIEIEDTQREDRHDLMMRLLMWREKHINEHNFVLILSFIIGICTAAAALILKFLIHFIQQLLTSHFNADSANYLYLIYPIIGILLAGLYVRYIVKDDISHGVTRILYAISQKKSRLKPHNITHRSSRVLSQSDSEDQSERKLPSFIPGLRSVRI